MNKTNYTLESQSGDARAGIIHTRRGDVQTPFFMSVATRAAIKGGVSMNDLQDMKAPVLLANTYHLHLRPGSELIERHGGLHNFAKWQGPILTDSGGFQVFSIQNKKITDDGVMFRSHIDGAKLYIDAEISLQIQHELGADIVMAFDECPPNIPNYKHIRRAVDRTTAWALRSLAQHSQFNDMSADPATRSQIFGIIQGGCYPDLRHKSLEEITALPFDGYALGGLAVGETHEAMYKVLGEMTHKMPTNKPRYLMGVGTPINLINAVREGIDMFDCVLPMRNARHGTIYTWDGALRITNTKFKDDPSVLDPKCKCTVCARDKHSRAYLHHLIKIGEDLGKRLLTIHNLSFFHQLMAEMRTQIVAGKFNNWADKTIQDLEKKI